MLLGNYTQLNANPGRNIGGFTNPYDWRKYSGIMKFYVGNATISDVTNKSSFNNGYIPPYSWALAPKAGGLVMNSTGTSLFSVDLIPQYLAIVNFTGSGDLTSIITGYGNLVCELTGSSGWSADIKADGNIEISFTGIGDLTATVRGDGYVTLDMQGSGELSAGMSLFLNMVAAMTGSGSLSADASLLVGLICAMSGGGSITADVTGQKAMSASLTGTGNLAADITAFAEMLISLLGTGVLNAGTGAIANMSVDLVVTGTGLTTANVGAAVWNAVASANNTPGTMGEKLNDAGSASNPWTEVIEGTYTAAEVLRLLASVAAGKTTIVDNGGGSATVVFRDINDTIDRVEADMQDSERINTTFDL